jgi:hypothetical protein
MAFDAPPAIRGENTWRDFSAEHGAIPVAVLLQLVNALVSLTVNAYLSEPYG